MTSHELRATIVARDRLARELRTCDLQLSLAMTRKDSVTWGYWATRRDTAWATLAQLDAQKTALQQ